MLPVAGISQPIPAIFVKRKKMKRVARIPCLLLATFLFQYCAQKAQPERRLRPLATVAVKAPQAQVLYDSLQQALGTYYLLTTAFAQSNEDGANRQAARLQQQIDSLPLQVLPIAPDTIKALQGISTSISAELVGLAGERTLQNKRVSYKMVSDMFFDLLVATGLSRSQTIYRIYSPKAVENTGACWLSNTPNDVNPYFGERTGDATVADSLHYN